MEEDYAKLREASTASMEAIRNELPVTKKVISAMLAMQLAVDFDELIYLGKKAIVQLDDIFTALTPVQYKGLMEAITSIAESEDARIQAIPLVATKLH